DSFTGHSSVFSEGSAVAVAVRIAPLRSVGEVEGFCPELKVEPLGDAELPEEAGVPLEAGRAAQYVKAGGAEAHPVVHIRIGTNGAEGINVEKLLPRPVVAVNRYARLDQISPLSVAWRIQGAAR